MEISSGLLYLWVNLRTDAGQLVAGGFRSLSWTMRCDVMLGSVVQKAWAPMIESAVTAPAVTAADKLLRGA